MFQRTVTGYSDYFVCVPVYYYKAKKKTPILARVKNAQTKLLRVQFANDQVSLGILKSG